MARSVTQKCISMRSMSRLILFAARCESAIPKFHISDRSSAVQIAASQCASCGLRRSFS